MRLIDADAYSNVLREKERFYKAHSQEDMIAGLFWARVFLGEQPTVCDSVKHGRWIKITGMAPPEHHGLHYCSVCNEPAPRDKHFREMLSDYCPACGAKMDGE